MFTKARRFVSGLVFSALLLNVLAVPVQADEASDVNLTVTEVSLYSTDGIQFTLANLGTTSVDPAVDVATSYSIDGTVIGSYHSTILSTNDYLNAGGSQTIEVGGMLTEGDHTVEVCINVTSVVAETTTADNCLSATLTVAAAPLPDLIVASATLDSDNSLNFVVSNIGSGDVDAALFPDLNFTFDFTSPDLSSSTSTSIPIDEAGDSAYRTAGGSTTIVLPTESEAPGCTMYFLLVADGNGEVTESDDLNNEYRGSFDFCATESGIDLYTTNNDTIHDLIMDFEVGNQGDTDVPVSFIDDDLGINYFYLDGVYVRQARWIWHTAGSYVYTSAGGSQTRYFPFYYIPSLSTMTLGTHTAMHCIDATDVVEELDETNNCDTTSFELTELPDLYSDATAYDTTTNTLSFTLGNDSNISLLDWFGNYVVYLNGTAVQTQNWISDSDSSYINAMSSLSRTYTFDAAAVLEGSNTVQVCIDVASNIAESDESNNCDSMTFTPGSEGGSTGPEGGSPSSGPTSSSGGEVSGGGGNFSQSNNSSSSSSASDDVVLTEDASVACGELPFIDVTETTVGYDAIARLWCMGVIHGRDGTHFAPDESINRDEASKVVSRLFGYVTEAPSELPTLTETSYVDVSVTDVLAYYIQTLTNQSFFDAEKLLGYFRPHEMMTGAEVADLLTKASGQTVTTEMVADYKGGETMSRAEFVALALNLFE